MRRTLIIPIVLAVAIFAITYRNIEWLTIWYDGQSGSLQDDVLNARTKGLIIAKDPNATRDNMKNFNPTTTTTTTTLHNVGLNDTLSVIKIKTLHEASLYVVDNPKTHNVMDGNISTLYEYNETIPVGEHNLSSSRMECLNNQSAFRFVPLIRNVEYDFTLQSTVQLVRHDGPSGIPQRCDWVIGSRLSRSGHVVPTNSAWGDLLIEPNIIFVQTENALLFNDHILKCLHTDERFIIIIGDSDMTTPRQTDLRFPKMWSSSEIWTQWLHDSRIIHIFVEHLDEWNHTKVTPIPLGMNPREVPSDIMQLDVDSIVKQFPIVVPIHNRTLKVRFTNRPHLRQKSQFLYRHQVKQLCETTWQNYCVSDPAPSGEAFYHEIALYPFVLCVHGGGIDPNPQAWTALLVGTIPIIERFAGDAIYNDLPVLLVDNITEFNLTIDNLRVWRDERAHMFEESFRKLYLQKLMADYWWNIILSKLS